MDIWWPTPGQEKLGLRSYAVANRGRTLWADERQRELERKNQSGPEWARVSQSEPERDRDNQREPEWVKMSQSHSDRVSKREQEWAWLSQKIEMQFFLPQKVSCALCQPKMKTLRGEPTLQLLYPALAQLICLNQQIGFYNVLVSAINIDI